MESTNNYHLGNVIATRSLHFNDQGLKKKITIKLGKPRKDRRPGGDYYCPFTIVGIGEEKVQAAHGADGIQALELAFKMIGALLTYYQKLHTGKITWNDSAWLGFSSPEGSNTQAIF